MVIGTKTMSVKKKTTKKRAKKVTARHKAVDELVRRTKPGLPKLVRDRVPEHIVRDNYVPVFHFVSSQEEYSAALQSKLLEEFEEFMEPDHFVKFMEGDYSELADVLDVIDLLIKAGTGGATHIGHPAVAEFRTLKAHEKGQFNKQIVLEDILDRSELR